MTFVIQKYKDMAQNQITGLQRASSSYRFEKPLLKLCALLALNRSNF